MPILNRERYVEQCGVGSIDSFQRLAKCMDMRTYEPLKPESRNRVLKIKRNRRDFLDVEEDNDEEQINKKRKSK